MRAGKPIGRRGHRRRGGFTLVELIVVISVIVVLVGLGLMAVAAVVRGSEIRRTEGVLRTLNAAILEWEKRADRKVSWGIDGEPDPPGTAVYDVHPDTAEVFIINEVLDTIRSTPAVQAILAQLEPDDLFTYQPGVYPAWVQSPGEKSQQDDRFAQSVTVLDAWGWPIYLTHPGRVGDPAVFPIDGVYPPDIDGTIRTYNEDKYGITANRRICFVSAGPDGDFGVMSEPEGTPDFEATRDNVFSYPVQRP